MPDYTLSVKITGDDSGLQKSVQNSEKAISGFSQKTKSLSGTLNEISGKFAKTGAALTLGITTPIALAGKSMVTAASDFNENLNKIDVAFGNSADSVKAWADTALESFGLSKNQALEATSLFGDMATSMGLSQSEAAEMSTSLAGLAGDMASFKNVGIDQAMTALNGVFTGETESLKQLGIVMTDVNLEEFATGLGLVYDEMTQAEKVQLRYNYVMEMSKNAQGDYARTADGTANSMRTFQGTVDNLMIALGQNLLPVLTPLIQKLTEIINSFANMDPKMQQTILIILGIVAAIGPLTTVIGGLTKAFSLLTSPVGLIITLIGAVTAGIVYLWNTSEGFRDVVLAIWDAICNAFQTAADFIGGIINSIVSFVSSAVNTISSVVGRIAGFFQSAFSAAANVVRTIIGGIQSFFVGFINAVESAWNGLTTFVGGIFDGIAAGFNALVNGVKSVINVVIGAINGAIWVINLIPGVNIPDIPYLLHGTDDWQGGFAVMNEGGRGELVNLPNGSQVIPHDVSQKYAKEAAKRNNAPRYTDFSGILEGITIQVISQTTVDGTPLKQTAADYTIRKIGEQQRAEYRSKGRRYAYGV